MKVSIHQPAYLPWLGYLSRIAQSDVFIFLDTVQFEKNSYTNRNKIKTASGPLWLTVPVLQNGHLTKPLSAIEIDPSQDWRKKHFKSIEMSYRKTSEFSKCFSKLDSLFSSDERLLTELCYQQLLFWLEVFKISTRIFRASELPVNGHKSNLILAICKYLNATEYISGPMGKGYLQSKEFEHENILLSYQDFIHPVYPQLYGDFLPAMGVIDAWLNCPDPSTLIKGR